MKEFKSKVAVITGAASGIGRGIAERCVHEGMKVVLSDIDEVNLAKAETELSTPGGTVLGVRTDVSKRSDIERLARRALDAFGRVDLLFNNAGVGAGGAPWEATWNDWEWVIGVDLWGVIHGVKVFTPLMLAQNTECHIVNTSSGAGLIVGGFSAPYSVAKHAVVALSESLYIALEQQKALVKVSVLCPGLVRTNIAEAERNRPAELRNEPAARTPEMEAGLAAFKAAIDASMTPRELADVVFDAIRKEQFYILPDPEWTEVIRLRTDKLLRMENPKNPSATILKLINRRG
ncbi:MAG TPA: SDR family NAD(P)-dependent oxidoreductase [Bryobacteraceae bacterium]|nr:SDR family NAD(P)-dependent oxidoreductase [Bryobacteraceae bacterium]